MKDWFFQTLKKTANYSRTGVLHALGADPTRVSRAGTEMEWLGKRWLFSPDEMLPGVAPGSGFGLNSINSVVAPVMLAMGAYQGFTEGGLGGGIAAIGQEIAVNAAIAGHAYTRVHEQGGVYRLDPGRSFLRSALRGAGPVGKFVGGAAGYGDMFARYAGGSILAAGFSNAVGGGILGMGAAFVGGNLGVRHYKKLAVASGALYLGKTAAMGTYSTFKAGYNHQQMRKTVQTDGSMASFMTQGAFTMRERAVMTMQKSGLNARSALGMEASYMHNPQRSYSSPYRMGY